ncbi:PREDICTED: 6-pyruvoyl tetrahydrobiopterin synthase [Bactrocera latifrons]|uniref:6-pyruvoyl tetrahydrobiopterin synthase n=2 Tax=Bactrocera latifrons TaxID=174628 RepID=A0A0K8U9N2_BACLA|nr:PREDICTED: 6-pyruvoyl tetrahydrobiopterin synthase [Bactrocera latifrons]XP_018783285.1 PREDICTED: 6-pyruvoyl tetrahydrobiopterin synthase [Bactrocera latifrons]XP_018783286.1 PREDICTED: 6-pyruvoyl tetrahydrobiopterin synthase [Bactrocera latifrons]
MSQPVAFLTRKETFSACHRLHSPHLSDAENAEVFGKCNHINGHGHNYTVEVTVRGPIDIRTGMVMNVTELKTALDRVVFKDLDHKNLDLDVDFFKKTPSTTENVCVYIWDNVRQHLKRPELLYEVKIYETDKNSVSYRGPYNHNGYYQSMQMKRSAKTSCTNISSDSD